MVLVYLTLWVLLIVVGLRVTMAAAAAELPPALTGAVVVAALVYLSGFIPGILGLFYTPVIYGSFVVLSLAALRLLAGHGSLADLGSASDRSDRAAGSWWEWGVLAVGLLGTVPLLSYLRGSLPLSLVNPNGQLGWDAVSYHLPGFVEFWQHHTLWSLDGPYQSYSFAFELIGNFLSHPFFSHWGLILAHVLALFLLLTGLAVAAKTLVPLVASGTATRWLPYAGLAAGMLSSIHAEPLANVGKNDVFMAACLLAALCFLLELAAGVWESATRRRSLVLLISTALGLALATKPSALAFVPFFALAAPIAVGLQGGAGKSRQGVSTGATVLAVSLLLGGFWLIRNLVVRGSLAPATGGWELSLLANLGNGALYEIKLGSLLFVAAVMAVFPGLYLLAAVRHDRKAALAMALLVSFHVVAGIAFAITPYGTFVHSSPASAWELRLGMPLFVAAALIYSLAAARGCRFIAGWGRRWQVLLASSLLLAVVGPLPVYWRSVAAAGLPGYEVIKGLPPTGVYAWVEDQTGPLRIYAAGLRPYGLYGPQWRNTLFYDLHSIGLSPLASGQRRISAVVTRFRPDLIIISIDPHPYSGAPRKPEIVAWMQALPDLFFEIYADATVSCFKVKPGAADRLRNLFPANEELRMGG